MDNRELDTNISEIEDRLERVRSLYEQYFCGIEKVEPQVPRKDLERRIATMRKEQIRNTAMRFKFQTLIQRYNTMSQHWGRVLREIENGTYKRDLARAAARFGVEEALTAVGRKRAERLATGLKAQLEKEEQRKAFLRKMTGDEYEQVAPEDIESDDFDDDAPTPPPVSGRAQQPAWQAPGISSLPLVHGPNDPSFLEQTYAPSGDEETAAPGAVAPAKVPVRGVGFFQNLRGQSAPSAGGPRIQASSAPQQGAPQQSVLPSNPQAAPYDAARVAPPGWSPPDEAYRQPAPPIPGIELPPPQAWSEPPSQRFEGGPSSSPAPKAKGGLRLGGGASNRRVNQEALNRIASTLGDDPPVSAAPPAVAQPAAPPAAPPRIPIATPTTPGAGQGSPVPQGRRPLLSNPLDLELPPSAPDTTPRVPPAEPTRPIAVAAPPAARVPPAAVPAAAPSGEGEARAPAVGLRPPNRTAQAPALKPPPKPAGNEALSSDRLREIYSQYVQSRRDRNESTAGITFDKLADSLRSQADKLREKHAAKKVDYEVVVKDGKTLIKPIVR